MQPGRENTIHIPMPAPTTRPSPGSAPSPAAAGEVWREDDLRADPHADGAKAEKVRRMFASIAHRYDLNNRLHSFGRDVAWRRAAVAEASLRAGDVVLDCACGTGDLAMEFARAGAAKVTGLDYTPEMLAVARRRSAERRGPASRIEWIDGDAMALPLADASVDVVSIAFGIRNVTDPLAALREFRRVLKPGGRVVILEFSRPRSPVIAAANDLYCKRIMPWTATLISGDRSGAYKYLPRSVETFLDRGSMAQAMRDAGFTAVTQRPLTFGVCVCYRGVARD